MLDIKITNNGLIFFTSDTMELQGLFDNELSKLDDAEKKAVLSIVKPVMTMLNQSQELNIDKEIQIRELEAENNNLKKQFEEFMQLKADLFYKYAG